MPPSSSPPLFKKRVPAVSLPTSAWLLLPSYPCPWCPPPLPPHPPVFIILCRRPHVLEYAHQLLPPHPPHSHLSAPNSICCCIVLFFSFRTLMYKPCTGTPPPDTTHQCFIVLCCLPHVLEYAHKLLLCDILHRQQLIQQHLLLVSDQPLTLRRGTGRSYCCLLLLLLRYCCSFKPKPAAAWAVAGGEGMPTCVCTSKGGRTSTTLKNSAISST